MQLNTCKSQEKKKQSKKKTTQGGGNYKMQTIKNSIGITNSVVGVGLYSGFLPRLEIVGTSRPKYRCYTKGGTLPSDNNDGAGYEIFCLICLTIGTRDIVSLLLKKYASRNGAASGSIIDFAKAEGARWVAKRKNFLFSNPNSTKACLWAQLQATMLERTDERTYDIKVGFWSGAWKCFLFEGEEKSSDPTSNLDLVARESLRRTLRRTIRNQPDNLLHYEAHVHAWLRVRSDFLATREVLDKYDAHYQKQRADYLVMRAPKEYFRNLYRVGLGSDHFRHCPLKEKKFVSDCFNLIGEEGFLNLCSRIDDEDTKVGDGDYDFLEDV
uniref:Uncharacterized protein n=1 Tax=Diastatea micrantha TaxID=368674 RepID=A0A1Z2QST3_9ASTR|nr:hypothetical protein Dias_mi1Pt0325 [Diastatea micrantha]ASA34508.1 hypothetical protein Dias_mi1Pt0325 [Diastatea micrantha]